jgi:hypothetical protein
VAETATSKLIGTAILIGVTLLLLEMLLLLVVIYARGGICAVAVWAAQ